MPIPDITYRLIEGHVLPKEPGAVVAIQGSDVDERFGPGCMFRCPCGERRIAVRIPPHESITYDPEGRPTIRASLGAHPTPPDYPSSNWCHAHMKGGRFELCGDAICPGSG